MRQVDRHRSKRPRSLSQTAVKDALRSAERHFDSHDAGTRQAFFRFPALERGADVRSALDVVFERKCAFCESPVADDRTVHRLRPGQEAVGVAGDVDWAHYWWLAYEWENLYLACESCHRAAGSRFPLAGQRGKIGTPLERLRQDERALLVDPCWDDPLEHLSFDDAGLATALSEVGETTIKVFRLNRRSLVRARRMAIDGVVAEAHKHLRPSVDGPALARLTSSDKPYSAALAQALRRLARASGVEEAEQEWAPPDVAARSLRPFARARRRRFQVEPFVVQRITLRDVRNIGELEIERHEGSQWTMLLGENGHGKSTVLRAVALALMGGTARERLRLDPDSWIRRGERQAEIAVWLEGVPEPRRITFERGVGMQTPIDDDVPVAMAAYGAGRLPPSRSRTSLPRRYRVRPRVESLFDPHAELMPADPWLSSLAEETFDFAARSLRRLLLEPETTRFAREENAIVLRRVGEDAQLSELSDGYRAMLTLAADMMSVFLKRYGSIDAAEGLVLVDEIGAHLHPRWQMQIIRAFREAFPRLQMIATTHDPLCLRGLGDREVVVLRRDQNRKVHRLPEEEVPPIEGLRVDELLTSEVFGLHSTMDGHVERVFWRYYELLGRRSLDRFEQEELMAVRAELDALRQFGSTRRERLALEAADRYIALEGDVDDPPARRALSSELEESLQRIWSGQD